MPLGVLTRALSERLTGWANAQDGNTVGALLIVVSSLTVAGLMIAVRELGSTYPVWQIMLARTAGQLVLLLPFMYRDRWHMLHTKKLRWHVLRVVTGFFGILGWFYSIAHLRLADAVGLSFSKALFLVGLAAMFLAEKPGVIGWGATVVGFIGMLVMVGPSGDSGTLLAASAAVAGAASGAVTTLVIKYLTKTETTATMMAYPALGLTLLAGIPSIFTWVPISAPAAPLFLLAVASGIITQWCFITAYRYGEASVLATVEYIRLVAAALAGYLLFGEVPTPLAFLGILLIVAASFVSVKRERIRAGIFH
ncbi:hypothetical protein MNBD_ALPHA09-389 [hydrothermal vent metagenome]|uniref:EamA domain-containing protein n=1 Tax=hydrothermal vent metagenome TaxID=652676 RepID=A0A3B0TGW4_9ZZZZ